LKIEIVEINGEKVKILIWNGEQDLLKRKNPETRNEKMKEITKLT